jgi:hypothetical protein
MEIHYFVYQLKYGFFTLFLVDRQRPGWSKTTPGDVVTYTTITATLHPKETDTRS